MEMQNPGVKIGRFIMGNGFAFLTMFYFHTLKSSRQRHMNIKTRTNNVMGKILQYYYVAIFPLEAILLYRSFFREGNSTMGENYSTAPVALIS